MSSSRASLLDRRNFLRSAGGSLAAGALLGQSAIAKAEQQATPEPISRGSAFRPLTDSEKVARIASNSYPIRWIFKSRGELTTKDVVAKMKAKYGEITMLDFPAFTKKTFPGVTKMDMWSSLFGDMDDKSQYVQSTITFDGKQRQVTEFDPSAISSKRWLEKMANVQVKEGVFCHHISNNAPRNICELDDTKRREGIEIAKKWLDGAAILGAKSMRVNSGGPRIAPWPNPDTSSYPKNPEIEKYLDKCIESFKEMADYGAKVGVKVTLENHWGLTANPINIRIIIEEVNNVFCEASPDFCNWEHKYLLYHALNDLAPYSHTTVHAKFWDRFGEPDVQRGVRIMLNNNYTGVFALEYEDGPWDGVEGAKYLYQQVMAAL
ncbi:sugar phosphate isomerase/epimerase family protein [Edaphobacter flagellatus]|uniref:sugar phosphate isomerase/epimerase family protein n=1 Tax=Edaphobacter flagellatus TaxID=1933044 RepID=UPI0021B18826|nr:sugar phosphate isomerase/epimerase [Edaphobacter flagellatus]